METYPAENFRWSLLGSKATRTVGTRDTGRSQGKEGLSMENRDLERCLHHLSSAERFGGQRV